MSRLEGSARRVEKGNGVEVCRHLPFCDLEQTTAKSASAQCKKLSWAFTL